MSYIIADLDGTLILENDAPNQPLIDHLNDQVMSGDAQILIVSARKIDRLTETRATGWALRLVVLLVRAVTASRELVA